MEATGGDLFDPPGPPSAEELVETLAAGEGWRIERIVSTGQATPPGRWLEQAWDEWVALLSGEATLAWEDGSSARLAPGAWRWIPAGERHRVEATSAEPACVWLAVHVRPRRGAAP